MRAQGCREWDRKKVEIKVGRGILRDGGERKRERLIKSM